MQRPRHDGHLFTRLPSSYTGVRFENRLRDTRELNVFTYRNYYNGGGVAMGDLTGDGLPELVLTANQRRRQPALPERGQVSLPRRDRGGRRPRDRGLDDRRHAGGRQWRRPAGHLRLPRRHRCQAQRRANELYINRA